MNEIEKIDQMKNVTNKPELYEKQKDLFRLTPGGYLYVIRLGDTDVYKIGISIDPYRRLKQIQAKSVIPLSMVYTNYGHDYKFAEKYLHYAFREKRVINEWFMLDLTDILHIHNLFPIKLISQEIADGLL